MYKVLWCNSFYGVMVSSCPHPLFPFLGISLGNQCSSFSQFIGFVWDCPHPNFSTKLMSVFQTTGHTMNIQP